jgi:cytochrome c2
VVVNDMFIDLNYLNAPRVDRCTSCHRAIDRPGFESKKEAARLEAELQKKLDGFEIPPGKVADARIRIEELKKAQTLKGIPNPFRTHPLLDTFVGSASPHPLLEFGCTACHRGQDRATNFARAGHTPMSPRQEHRWERQWSWEAQEFLETPMYPRQYFQSSCIKCHSGQINVPRGAAITRGEALVELYGCYACHKIDNWRFANLRKPGPDLNGIAEKTTPEWAVRWISDPHSFRPTTRMPAFFYQRNMVGPAVPAAERADNMRMQSAEIQSIVAFLFKKSTRRTWQAPPAGDAARGQQLVASVGCLGCHLAQDAVKDEGGVIRPARRDDFPIERNYGFNLVGVGTKANPAWLFNWLKNPKGYYPTAPMPDLRLTDQEAADITAFLMKQQRPDFVRQPVPPVDPRTVAELAKGYLINTLSEDEAMARLRTMPLQDQLVYLGQRSIEKYGCYSCHIIKGFEGMKPIGTELTIEGSKALHLFDFGAVHEYEAQQDQKHEHILHTVPSFIYNKLRSPRVYDDRREKAYGDKLKMPNFFMSPAEAQSITSVVLGLTKDKVNPNRLAAQDPRSRAVQEGRKVISQHNCRACHLVEGYGRAIAITIADPMMLPPDLTPEGSRVQSPWLFNFLKDPTVMRMRPWLSVRMPTFHFTDEEANTLVQSFASDGKVLQFDQARMQDPPSKNIEIGRAAFEMLRCAQCHSVTPGAAPTTAQSAASLAPNLTLARVRLQHDWIPDWIRRPNEIIPGTRMPTNFPRDSETADFTSPLIMAIDTPPFAQYKARLLPLFGSEDALRKGLKDVPTLSGYLRDYIWSIGPSEMRPAQQTAQPPSVPIPAAPAAQQGRIETPPLKSPRISAQNGRSSR